jgi:tRNA (guanine37-N1)-methyltransferase
MRIDILSLFPAIAQAALGESIMGRAQEDGFIELHHHNIRDWATGKHRTADDTPYGGGQGMVMKCEPVGACIESLLGPIPLGKKPGEIFPGTRVIFLTPGGLRFDQKRASDFARLDRLILLCGHYEGVDQRAIDAFADEELSIGDYVLTNGALAAAVVVDAVVRLIPGVLGDAQSAVDDSFASGLLEFPHYTRPPEFRGMTVPDVLLSGHHAEIAKWRRAQALEKTRRIRPDLLP